MIEYLSHLTDDQQDGVLTLIAEAANQDGIPPLAEHIVLHLRHGGDKDDRHLLISHNETIVGYAHIDLTDAVAGSSAELVVHPKFRHRGYGQALLDEVTRITSPRLWSHGDLPDAQKLAASNGFTRVRAVIQMRRSLAAHLPDIQSNVEVRTFLPGLDDESWLDINNKIFQGHPEQGNWTLENLHQRMKENWFDPLGFFLGVTEEGISAFCWTKIHGGHSHSHDGSDNHGHDPIGEIYAMGVDPHNQGQNLGAAMTIAGLMYMRAKSLSTAMLYVDAENLGAISLYKRLGFTEWGQDVMYRNENLVVRK
ncbi:MAG: mycothiol synthase [Actinomycetota bacterium]